MLLYGNNHGDPTKKLDTTTVPNRRSSIGVRMYNVAKKNNYKNYSFDEGSFTTSNLRSNAATEDMIKHSELSDNEIAEIRAFNKNHSRGNKIEFNKPGASVLDALYKHIDSTRDSRSLSRRINLGSHGQDQIVTDENGVRHYKPKNDRFRVSTTESGTFGITPGSQYNKNTNLTYDQKTRLRKDNPKFNFNFKKPLPTVQFKRQEAVKAAPVKPIQPFTPSR